MKTKIIKTLKNELLIIELPEKWEIIPHDNGIMAVNDSVLQWEIEGSYTLLGSPDEIKEDDVVDLCDRIGINNPLADCDFFAHYGNDETMFETALESFHSALESEINWNVNPYEKPETCFMERFQTPSKSYEEFYLEWHEAEQKTFDKKRTLIFAKNENKNN